MNTYEDCPFQFFLEYILELPSISGKKALLGTIVHLVLEILAKASKTNHYACNDKYTDPDYLLDIVWARFVEEEKENYVFTDAEKEFCRKSIDLVLGTQYDPKNLKILDIEKQFQIPIERDDFQFEYYDIMRQVVKKGWYELRGTVDLVTELDDETIEIVDWKTGKRSCWITGAEKDCDYLASKDIQVRMYDLAISLLYPEYKHRLITVHYINEGGPFTVTLSDEDRVETLEIIKDKLNRISADSFPLRIKEEKRNHKWKCQYTCHFGKTCDKNGNSWCDNFYAHMSQTSMDEVIDIVGNARRKKEAEGDTGASGNKAGNRRNVYKDDDETKRNDSSEKALGKTGS